MEHPQRVMLGGAAFEFLVVALALFGREKKDNREDAPLCDEPARTSRSFRRLSILLAAFLGGIRLVCGLGKVSRNTWALALYAHVVELWYFYGEAAVADSIDAKGKGLLAAIWIMPCVLLRYRADMIAGAQ